MCIFALRTYLKDPWTRKAKDTTALSGGFFYFPYLNTPKCPFFPLQIPKPENR